MPDSPDTPEMHERPDAVGEAMLHRNRRLAAGIAAGTDVCTLDEVIDGVRRMGRALIDVPGPRGAQLADEVARLRGELEVARSPRPAPTAEPGTILAAWQQIARIVGREDTSPASVVDAVAYLVEHAPAAGALRARESALLADLEQRYVESLNAIFAASPERESDHDVDRWRGYAEVCRQTCERIRREAGLPAAKYRAGSWRREHGVTESRPCG